MGNEERVIGSDSQTDDKNPNPEGGQEDHPEGGEGKENRIPISRAEEMWARREEKLKAELRKEWEDKELSPLRQQYDGDRKRLQDAEIARLKAMGWLKEEPPKPVTQDQLEKLLDERLEKARTQEREERLQLYHAQRINDGWEILKTEFPSLVSKKAYQNAVLAIYAENPNAASFASIGREVAKEFDSYSAERETAAAKEREGRRSPANRVVPGGRGAAGGSGAKEEKRKSVAERLVDRIRAAKEG